ncbi:EexN family lipoprotein [Methylorubrum thiocyanatum]|jgi:hypothetical protein|uniref:EexN family lipoprotein n=1 Tax=Methylorubrum thiocyanatum TaxID=47958 RepID=UPI00383B50CC
MRVLVLGLPVLLGLTACDGPDRSARPESRTVLEFLEDPQGLEETWGRCRNDPGGIGQTAECRNAGVAKERLMMLGRERAIRSLKG